MAATVADDTFKCKFVNKNILISIKKITKVSIGLDNGLAPSRRQVIIWTNDGIVYRRIYASLGHNELICFKISKYAFDIHFF